MPELSDLDDPKIQQPADHLREYLQNMLNHPLDFMDDQVEPLWRPQPEERPDTNHDNSLKCQALTPVLDTQALYWWSQQGLLPSGELQHLLYRQFLQYLLLSYRLNSTRIRAMALTECRHIWSTFESVSCFQDH